MTETTAQDRDRVAVATEATSGVGQVIAFLASDKASYITGAVILLTADAPPSESTRPERKPK